MSLIRKRPEASTAPAGQHECPWRDKLQELADWAYQQHQAGAVITPVTVLRQIGAPDPPGVNVDPMTGCAPVTPAGPGTA